jgi:hypothetical protein
MAEKGAPCDGDGRLPARHLVVGHGGLNCDLIGGAAIHRNQLTFTETLAMLVQNLKNPAGSRLPD